MTGEGVSVPKSGRFDQVYNTESTVYLPAYGMAEVVDGLRTNGGLRVRKPTGDSLKNIVVIGSAPVPPLSNGQMQANQYLRVLVTETTGETLAPGDEIGSESGEFGGKQANTGFIVIEVPDADNPPFVAMALRTVALGEVDPIVRITGSVLVAAGSGGSDCEGSAFEADASGNWPSGVGSIGSGVGHNAYTGYLQTRDCILDPWQDVGSEVYVDDMNGRTLAVGERYQVVRQGSIGGVASYTTRDDSGVVDSGSGDSGDSGSGSGSGSGDGECVTITSIDCGGSGSGGGEGGGECILVGDITISCSGGTGTGTFTLTIPTVSHSVQRCSNQSGSA